MTDHPILFSAPMIRALLDGRKTQTRRVLKTQPATGLSFDEIVNGEAIFLGNTHHNEVSYSAKLSYRTGQRLWVRENYQLPAILNTTPPRKVSSMSPVQYPATDGVCEEEDGDGNLIKVRPSIHMPRWASRLTLTVTDVRVQRLQDISEADARAEGAITPAYPADENHTARELLNCYGPDCPTDPARSCNKHGCWGVREEFKDLWNSINGPDAWDANPWVVATSFTVHKCNIDQMEPTP